MLLLTLVCLSESTLANLSNDMFGLNVSVRLANAPYITDGDKYSKNASTISYVRARDGDDNGGEE